jgi:hypothetical protein
MGFAWTVPVRSVGNSPGTRHVGTPLDHSGPIPNRSSCAAACRKATDVIEIPNRRSGRFVGPQWLLRAADAFGAMAASPAMAASMPWI